MNYKILNQRSATAQRLSKWNVGKNMNCTKCNMVEDELHLLYRCENVKNIWKKVSNEL